MTWPIWCEIVCKECSDTVPGRFNYDSLHKKEMKNEATKLGWKIINDDWLCKHCLRTKE